MKYDKVYDQVTVPSAGGTTPAGKDSSNCDDALGKPSRFTRAASVAVTPSPDSQIQEARDEQLGTNIELIWTRFGKDKPTPRTDQGFKKNFHNSTD